MSKDEKENLIDTITKTLADQGKLIEIGWVSFRMLMLPPNLTHPQIASIKMAYFAGAQHLWASILTMLSTEGTEATDRDLKRMSLIDAELAQWGKELKEKLRKEN